MIETIESPIGQAVKMTALYDYLELTKDQYSRFVKSNILENPYFEENIDFIFYPNGNIGKRGQFRQEYLLTFSTAKKITVSSKVPREKTVDLILFLSKKPKQLDIDLEIALNKTNRKELLFAVNLSDLLEGIYTIKTQFKCLNYRIDFYIPELNLAIEYDEVHHKNIQKYDIKRQQEIEKELGCTFIRVPQNNEMQALNKILKFILNK